MSNDFYRILLGPSMTYSCALWTDQTTTLEQAQANKYELICRKLGLADGQRLLDVGCGWGGMVLHAADAADIEAVGVTVSIRQQEWAAKVIADLGVEPRVQVLLKDYRDVDDGPYDAISSIGMFEHVGRAKLREYFECLYRLLRPGGRLLNHGISNQPAPGSSPRSVGMRELRRLAGRATGNGPASPTTASPIATCSPTASCTRWAPWSRSCSRWASRSATWKACASTTP